MEITSRDNPKIKHLVKLIGSKKERSASRLFVVEGVRSCADAFKEYKLGHIRIKTVFFVKAAFDKCCALSGIGDIIDEPDIEFYEISKELADRISPEGNTQGIFATAVFVHKTLPDKLSGNKYIVLDGVQDPGNLGTVLRTADAVGLDGVILTQNCCELYNPKVIRSTMGSLSRVDIFVENDFQRVIDVLDRSGVDAVASVVKNGELISKVSFGKKTAVVIGNEGSGMTEKHIKMCKKSVTIDMRGNLDSLNASIAAAVFMWEMTKEC